MPLNVVGVTNDLGGLHDSAAALVQDGRVVFAETEERISRVKHDGRFPVGALDRLLAFAGLGADEIDCYAIAWPRGSYGRTIRLLTSRRLSDLVRAPLTVAARAPRETLSVALARALWERGPRLSPLVAWGAPAERVRAIDHERAHAASAYRVSGFDDCLAVTMDGLGPGGDGGYVSGAAFRCQHGRMELIEAVPPWASLGCFYASVTLALGFKTLDGEGKTMGLAAYGDPEPALADLQRIAPTFEGGAWRRATPWWTDGLYALSDGTDVQAPRWLPAAHKVGTPRLFRRTATAAYLARIIERHGEKNVAAAAQRILEETVLAYFQHLHERTGARRFALAGGLFLNVKMNKRLLESGFVDAVYLQPHAGDSGTALGAALEAHAELGGEPVVERLQTAALGSSFDLPAVERALRAAGDSISWERPPDLAAAIAERLTAGVVLGYFAGRAEWGPRALGQRSVLADPRDPAIKDRINHVLKRRDWFMPFAPSILEERAADYLACLRDSPFMILADDVTPRARREIPAAIHIDGTARPHIVRKSVQPEYHAVLRAFEARTGVGAVLNTSFNRHGVPIVDTPADAIEHLVWGAVDELAIGPYLVRRRPAGT